MGRVCHTNQRIVRMARSINVTEVLSGRELDCAAMYYFDGLNIREIAEALGVGKPSVQSYLDRCRAKLAQHGLTPRRPERTDLPTIATWDPARLDRLGPDDVKALW